MPAYFQRPENALNRAKEFIDVGKQLSALEVLNDIIRSKKHRQWSETHESIMRLYLKLCTDLQKSLLAKDGLFQYRNICKDTNLNSFKNVIEGFLNMAERKASAAREESTQTVLDIEDLDAIQTPESILLSTVSGEDQQDRTDRIMLMPWVKFLWESFRNILELLKNNYHLERIYADVAKRAFAFCLAYKRRTEFHKLCDILRNHLNQLENAVEKPQAIQQHMRLDHQDTIQCLVDTRFEQLDKSIAIDLWQEAFKAIESIHFLISRPKQKAKPSLLDNFYQKQASVYWMANNKLFHAAALHRLFVLRKEQKKTFSLDSEEAQKTASQVLLATLSVPIIPVPSEMEKFLVDDSASQEKTRRLSALLRIQTPPTRVSLLNDLVALGVFQCVSPELQQLYALLQTEFNPLTLCSKVKPLLDSLSTNETTSVYVESLKEVTLVRLIKQVSQVYQSISFSRLAEMSLFATPMELEWIVVETARTNGIEVKIDHQSQSLWFGADVSLIERDKLSEGPVIQDMPSKVFSSHLTEMARALYQAAQIICSKELQVEYERKRQKVLKKCQNHEMSSHKAMMKRKLAIEERKEYLENVQRMKEQKERVEEEKKELEIRKVREKNLHDDMKKEEEEKKKKEIEEMKRKIAEDKLESLKKTPLGARAFADITAADLKDLDPNDIMVKQLQQMEKERKDKETKLKGQEKKIDYLERAKRMVELPLLEKQYKEQIVKDKQFHEEMEDEMITTAIAEHKRYVETRDRLIKMKTDNEVFLEIVQKRRRDKLAEDVAKFELDLAKERQERLEKRRKERKEKRKEEAARLQKEMEEKQVQEAEEEKKRKDEEERKIHEEKMEQIRLKQLQKEKEVEEKMRRKEEESTRVREDERRRDDRKKDDTSWRNLDSSEDWRPKKEEERRVYRPPGASASWRESEPNRDRRSPPPHWRDERPRHEDSWRRGGDYQDSPRGERRDRGEFDRFGRDRDRDYRERDLGRARDTDRREERFRDRDQDRYRDRDQRDRDRDQDRHRDRDQDRYRDRDQRDRDRDQDRYRDRDQDRYRDRDQDRYRDSDRYRDRDRSDRDRDRDRDRGWRDREPGYDRRRTSPIRRSDQDDRSWRRDDKPPSRKPDSSGDQQDEDGWETVTRRR